MSIKLIPWPFQPDYGDITEKHYFRLLRKANPEQVGRKRPKSNTANGKAYDVGAFEIRFGAECQSIRMKTDRSDGLLTALKAERSITENADVAILMGISSSALSGAIYKRGFTRDQLLTLLLLKKQPPSPQEVDHILMEFSMPSLMNTCRHGLRNSLIRLAFQCAGSDPAGMNYLNMLQVALLEMGQSPTVGTRYLIADLTDAEQRTVERWKTEAGRIHAQATNPYVYRRYLLNRFVELSKAYKRTNGRLEYYYEEAYDRMQQWISDYTERYEIASPADKDTFRKYFQPNGSMKYGERGSLIWVCASMGCSLNAVNRVLGESDHAFLYPRSTYPDEISYCSLVEEGVKTHAKFKSVLE